MSIVAAFTWFGAIGFGVFLFAIWLVELDRDVQRSAATRLPVPVISTHALLAIGGVPIWLLYLVTDDERLAWTSVALLGGVALLGLIMAIRWIKVIRTPLPAPVPAAAVWPGEQRALSTVPAERNFPPFAVICHGIVAVTTVTLVVLTALGIGGS